MHVWDEGGGNHPQQVLTDPGNVRNEARGMGTQHICSDLCCCGSHVSCVKYSSLMAYCKHCWAHSVAPPPDRDSWPLCSAVGVQPCLVCLFAHQKHSSPRWNFNAYMWFTFAQDVKQHVRVCASARVDFHRCTVSKGSIERKLGLASGLFLPSWVCVLGLHVKEERFVH